MNYRLYSFVNHIYMSPLQWGIQTAHVATKMMAFAMKLTYAQSYTPQKFIEWNDNGPTIIICQGGNVGMLHTLADTLEPLCDKLDLPFGKFYEDQESLGGVITCVGVLVPETIYDAEIIKFTDGTISSIFSPDQKMWVSGTPMFELIKTIKTARLA